MRVLYFADSLSGGFCILIFADDLRLNDYAALEFFTEFSNFSQMTEE